MNQDPRNDSAEFLGEEPKGFRIELSLRLPRDRVSVPLVRHLAEYALQEVGANEDDAHDVELALAEACANVLTHAGPGHVYDVEVLIGPYNCVIRVVDVGAGFDTDAVNPGMSDADAESGRGVGLMRVLMDHVRLVSEPDRGTVVQLVKSLRFDDDVPARKLMLAELAAD
ncbi:MAG: ATP-binding protein [Actinobacteria bacterium]|nr:ATP-binding protein [Actinomycetota bacterium]